MSSILQLSSQYRIVTTEDVLGELKDSKKFPFEIETVAADEKSMGLVKEFAKKTGDIASLSQIDMELIAVAFKMYQ